MYPVRLSGQRTVLREFQPDDVDDALAVVGDDRVTTWLSFDSRDRDQAASMVANAIDRAKRSPRDEYYLAMTRQDDDRLMGFVRLALGGVRAAKLGYAVGADQWGQGYGTDAVRIMVSFGFEQLCLHRISAAIGPDNTASIAVIQHLGFVREGRIRDHVHTGGAWRDSLLFSLLENEWLSTSTPPLADAG